LGDELAHRQGELPGRDPELPRELLDAATRRAVDRGAQALDRGGDLGGRTLLAPGAGRSEAGRDRAAAAAAPTRAIRMPAQGLGQGLEGLAPGEGRDLGDEGLDAPVDLV